LKLYKIRAFAAHMLRFSCPPLFRLFPSGDFSGYGGLSR
jgi:hypothetical protein